MSKIFEHLGETWYVADFEPIFFPLQAKKSPWKWKKTWSQFLYILKFLKTFDAPSEKFSGGNV